MSHIERLSRLKLIQPPKWLPGSVQYETIMGSEAYGVANDKSDMDVYGFCIPPRELVFPHLAGEIPGFGRQTQRFAQYQQHHIQDHPTYDISIYSIVKYFQLCMENNPNMIDSLFTPVRCVLYASPLAKMVRESRRMFLHKGAWHKFKGYAYSQMAKLRRGANRENPDRAESVAKYGYDVKFAYHLVRLLGEVEQIMIEHDLDLQRNREQLKSVRRGEWSFEYLVRWFQEKEAALESVYSSSDLRYKPDEQAIKGLLLNCLEQHYGALDGPFWKQFKATPSPSSS